MSQSSDGDDDAPRQALPFALNAATQTGTATTAEHYLAQVHAQASALPTILRASGRAPDNLTSHPSNGISKQGHRNPRTRSTPPEKAPNKIWQEHICQDYTRLQTALQGTAFKKTNAATQIPELREEWRAYFLKHRPSLPILRQLDFIALQDAIHALDEAVPKEEEPALEALVNAGLAEWAFSLLAFIEPPLFADMAAVVRSLWEKGVSARSRVANDDSEALAALNVIITILGTHFKQADVP